MKRILLEILFWFSLVLVKVQALLYRMKVITLGSLIGYLPHLTQKLTITRGNLTIRDLGLKGIVLMGGYMILCGCSSIISRIYQGVYKVLCRYWGFRSPGNIFMDLS